MRRSVGGSCVGDATKIKWDIAAKPPCDVYQSSFRIVPVTEAAYQKRAEQIRNFIAANLNTDILAFQEVSGEAAVRDVLPNNGADYEICSFATFKVQRLAIAWKRTLGSSSECVVERHFDASAARSNRPSSARAYHLRCQIERETISGS